MRKRLKCNAHVVLAVDAALEKTFKHTETLVGTSNLISSGPAHVFSSSPNSIWCLGLIASAKLVSPSHMKEAITLYKEYTNFLKENVNLSNEYASISTELLRSGFKGLVSNKFGRVGELSKATDSQQQLLELFFERWVDVHANKLFLAVDAYLKSRWLTNCCAIASTFYDEVVIPIKKVIGIDEFKKLKGNTGRI